MDGYVPGEPEWEAEGPRSDVLCVDDAFEGPFLAPVDDATFPELAEPDLRLPDPGDSAAQDLAAIEITTDMTELSLSRNGASPERNRNPAHERQAKQLPPLDLLNLPISTGAEIYRDEIQQNSLILTQTLREFGMECSWPSVAGR
ncbi:hypothetical protein HS125_13340 [bacterium]|nr:hypothetical protein [bacterium]